MERKKRGYKRLVDKKRDYRLFAIACEGSVRERDYFERFEVLSTRISVDLISEAADITGRADSETAAARKTPSPFFSKLPII